MCAQAQALQSPLHVFPALQRSCPALCCRQMLISTHGRQHIIMTSSHPISSAGSSAGMAPLCMALLSLLAVSPMQDATLESMMAASTPRQFSLNTGGHPSPLLLPSGAMGGGQLAGGRGGRHGGGPGGGGAPPLLTYPSYPSPELSGGLDEGGE